MEIPLLLCYPEVHDSFDNESYRMNRRPRGKCLIINIENFHGEPYPELQRRKGAEADSSIMLFVIITHNCMLDFNSDKRDRIKIIGTKFHDF